MAKKKRPSGHPAKRDLALPVLGALRDYERWMAATGSLERPDIELSIEAMQLLFRRATRAGLSLIQPSGVDDFVDILLDSDADEGEIIEILLELDQYVHFRLDQDSDFDRWAVTHIGIEEALTDVDEDAVEDGPDGLLGAFDIEALQHAAARTDALPEEVRRVALADLPLVAGVRPLLDWIGTSRPITSTGALRRADIEQVAAMIGINAAGTAGEPTWSSDPDIQRRVQSMWDLPVLAAWWEALSIADVVERTASRLRPGSVAREWLAAELPPLEAADMLAGSVLAELLVDRLEENTDIVGTTAFQRVVAALVAALDGVRPIEPERLEGPYLDEIVDAVAASQLGRLAELGIIVDVDTEYPTVPEPIAGTVARGVLLAVSLARGIVGVEDDDFDEDDRSPFDDPAVRAEMARLGIVHTPGMAAQLLGELAPLLAEDGIDLDNLEDTELETLNAALARATERRNMELSTPVGVQHDRAVTVLRLLSEALEGGDRAVARIVLDGIPPESDDDRPTVAQVIGVAAGVLDAVHGASAFSAGVARARIPEWDAAAQAAARDMLAAAGQAGAFGAIDTLIRRYRGKAVLEGAALAVSATVAARAAQEGAGLRETAERLVR